MTEVFSVTGEPLKLKEESVDDLLKLYDRLETERSVTSEKLSLVGREIARRMNGASRLVLKDFSVTVHPRVYVSRRHES